MLELEKTYFLKELPKGFEKCHSKEVFDIYIPKSSEHPVVRVRKNGDKYEITKKQPIAEGDWSKQREETIHLSEDEFKTLSQVKGKPVRKIRYYYEWEGFVGEIDVFQDDLAGLILVDFEFKSEAEMENFKMPPFCLKEVTQETFLAGGMLCGKSYKDIEQYLKRLGYKKM